MPDGRIRPRFRPRPSFDHGRPIERPSYAAAAIVCTCLVAALLPLLRAPTHAVVINLPVVNGFSPPPEAWPPGLVVHRVAVTAANEILWNYELVTQAELVERLETARISDRRPGIVFAPEPMAGYGLSAKVLNLLVQKGVTEGYFCLDGLAGHAAFDKGQPRYRSSLTRILPHARPEEPFRPKPPPECGYPRSPPVI